MHTAGLLLFLTKFKCMSLSSPLSHSSTGLSASLRSIASLVPAKPPSVFICPSLHDVNWMSYPVPWLSCKSKKAKLKCLIGFLGKGKTDLN